MNNVLSLNNFIHIAGWRIWEREREREREDSIVLSRTPRHHLYYECVWTPRPRL